jgi:uncharacterized repeat protein (TIGR03803 family)
MSKRHSFLMNRACVLVAAAALLSSGSSAATTEKVLVNFTGGVDGGDPASALTFDGAGNAYGTTVTGGKFGCGTVFTLQPAAGGRWQEKVLHDFTCYADGKNPYGGVTLDAAGNLYGTTVAGGSGGICSGDGCGVLYQLTPKGETVLHNFTGGKDGFGPGGAVVIGKTGHIFGTTPDGGAHSAGTIYEVAHVRGQWREKIVYAFTGGADGGVGSLGPLLLDATGNLYGVTEIGGAHSGGTVFKASRSGGKWNLTTLYAFAGKPDLASPYGGVIGDAKGNLYGTTYYGGAAGVGGVFQLSPARGGWTEHVMYAFKGGNDGGSSTSSLFADSKGNLYGTTSAGGGAGCDCGTVFRLTPSRQESILHSFGGSDGHNPYYGLTLAPNGDLFGTTAAGGLSGQGTIFEQKP